MRSSRSNWRSAHTWGRPLINRNIRSDRNTEQEQSAFAVKEGFVVHSEDLQGSLVMALANPATRHDLTVEKFPISQHLLTEGLTVNYSDSAHPRATTLGLVPTERSLILRVVFKGMFRQLAATSSEPVPGAPCCYFHLAQPGKMNAISYIGEPEFEVVALYISLAKLNSLLGTDLQGLPVPIQKFNQSRKSLSGSFQASKRALNAARGLLTGFRESHFSALFARSKGIELLCLLFEDWKKSDQAVLKKTNRYRLSNSDRRKLARIHRQLSDSFYRLHSIESLSARVELNRNKLHYGFKALYGVTVNSFQVGLRMEWAREQLTRGDMTVSEIADCLHYQEPVLSALRTNAILVKRPLLHWVENRESPAEVPYAKRIQKYMPGDRGSRAGAILVTSLRTFS